jgi:hypothetical protein
MNYTNVPWAAGLPVKLYDGAQPKVGTKCTCACGVQFVGIREDVICPTCADKLNQPAGPPPPREIVCEKCRTLSTELSAEGLCPGCIVALDSVGAKHTPDSEPEWPDVIGVGVGLGPDAGAGKSGPMVASMPEGSLLMRRGSPLENGEFGLSPLETDLTAQVCALRQELDEAKAALGIPATVRLVDGIGRLRDKLRSAKRRAPIGASRAY